MENCREAVMKNLSLLFIALLLIQLNTIAQEGWFLQSSGTSINLNSVYFSNSNLGWAVGDSGTIIHTTDGGENWNSQTSGRTDALRSICFAYNNAGWIVVDEKTILKTTNGGVLFVEEELIDGVPNRYSLTQNYPNPFNPTTKINFTIPTLPVLPTSSPRGEQAGSPLNPSPLPDRQAGYLGEGNRERFILYDILGKKIATLVNEVKPAGAYEVKFNAEGLPSEIYFCRLQAGYFVQTKKMVLIK
jgi:hypothetical protein